MRRIIVLGVLVVVSALSLVVAAQQPATAPKVLEVTKLKDNLFVLKGGGGNTAVFVMDDGVTVVDAKNPGWGQPILDKIKELTNKPVVRLINTHTHADHVGGNVEFPATIDIVTQENTKANMEKMIAPSGFPPATSNIFKDNNGRGMPKRTFKEKMSIGKGNDQVDLYYFGRGHTNGDAWVVFPSLRVMHAADMFSGKNLPLLDANNGGSGVAIPDSLQKAYDTVKDVDVIITGHSTEMTRPDLKEYAEFNRDFLNDMSAARSAGKTAEEVAGSWTIPAKYAGYSLGMPGRLKSNVQIIFDELSVAKSK
jgi:glyoxylase-like metal-dependent hydrolase (beta-lactamase superfamily II)